MGKIADALDKIDTLDELDSLHKEEAEMPILEPEKSSPQPVNPVRKVQPFTSPSEANGKWDARLFKAVNKDQLMPEVFKTLRSKILHPLDDRPVPKTIMVASSIPKEGKSFVTANLGISFATGIDQHCLLIDCDLRRPTLARMFGIRGNVGLADYLREQVNLSGLIARTSIQKLTVLPSGKAPQNPAELLSSARMQFLLKEVSSRYDDRIIIFDSPPMLMAAESMVLAGQVDAVILVVRRGKAKKSAVEKLIESIGEEKILGIVFNDHKPNYMDQRPFQGYGYDY